MSGDMVLNISAGTGAAAKFPASGVIDCTGTLGDGMEGLAAIAVYSDVYRFALKNDLIATVLGSQGGFFKTFRGLAVNQSAKFGHRDTLIILFYRFRNTEHNKP